MASLSKFRFNSIHSISLQARRFSSILNPDSTAPLSSKEKSRAALSLLKVEKNPERILEICRAASLTPDSHLDRIAFSIAVSKLTEWNYFEGIRGFIEELKTRPDLKNERFISHAIVLYGQAGLLDNALQSFEKMHELGVRQSVKALNALLFSCILAKRYDEMKRVYLDFPGKYGVQPNLDTYNTVIKGFCESGTSSSCYSVIAEMVRKNCKPNSTSFGTLVAGFYKEEKFEEVGKVMELMKKHGVEVGIGFYNVRIRSLCKLKRTTEAKALVDGILLKGMKPNSATYCHLIHGYCKEGKLDKAKTLFRNMIIDGFQPESDCYFTLVYFLCQGEDFEGALDVSKECIAKGWFPNLTTMKTLVNGLAKISMVDEAKELIAQIKEKFSHKADVWNEIEGSLAN